MGHSDEGIIYMKFPNDNDGMTQHPIQVLVVDDESDFCILTKQFLEMSRELEVDTVCSVGEAMTELTKKRYDVIVSDYQMPGINGIQFLKSLRAAGDGTPFILFTGKGREEVVIEALNCGADSYLQKGGKAVPQYVELEHRILTLVQRHRGREAFLDSEARFEQLTEYGGIVIWEIDADGLFTYVSGACEAVWGGYHPDELVGKKSFYDLTPESERESFKVTVFDKIRRKERFVNMENPMTTNDRRIIWVSSNGIPLLNSDGTLRGYRGSDIDITERKQTEEALRVSKQIIEGIIKVIPVRIFWKDRNLIYTGCNAIFARDAGYSDPKDIIGKDDYQMVWRDQAEKYQSDDRHVIESGCSMLLIEEPQKTPNGDIITLLTSKIPLRNSDGDVIGVLGTYMDLTERKRAEEALQASERMLADIIDFLPDATFVVDLEGKVMTWNKAIEKMTGVSKDEMVGQGDHAFAIPFYGNKRHQLLDLLTLDDEELKQKYDYVTRIGESLFAETFCSALNGGRGAYVWATATSMFNDQGERIGAIESIRDITERKRAEEALRESIQRYELVMEGSSAGLWDSDVINKHIHFSSHWKAMRGYTDDEIGDSEQEWISRIHPDDAPRIVAAIQAHLEGKTEIYEEEYRVRRKDGSIIWVLDRGKAVRNASGKVIRNVGSEIDITERKQAEELLRESVQRYELVMEGSSAGLWDWDVPNKRIHFSSQWKAMRGYTDAEIGDSETEWSSRIHPDDESRVLAALQAHFEGQTQVYEEEYRIRCKDGSLKWILDRGKAVRDAMGRTIRAAGSEIDITERKRAEVALRQANTKLSILNSITRHDISNQLMVVNGLIELSKQREMDHDLAQNLEKMSRAATNVQEQIAFTKDYQELGIKAPAWASVGRRVASAFAMLHPQGMVLEDRTEGIEVLTDPLADKVHYNLIDNSMRHGGNVTRIKVSAEQVGDAMMIVYEDDGKGIDDEQRKHLFEKGFGKNTGYGLFLIQEILAITGITIAEKGVAGKGVRFEMLVPPGAWRRSST